MTLLHTYVITDQGNWFALQICIVIMYYETSAPNQLVIMQRLIMGDQLVFLFIRMFNKIIITIFIAVLL